MTPREDCLVAPFECYGTTRVHIQVEKQYPKALQGTPKCFRGLWMLAAVVAAAAETAVVQLLVSSKQDQAALEPKKSDKRRYELCQKHEFAKFMLV